MQTQIFWVFFGGKAVWRIGDVPRKNNDGVGGHQAKLKVKQKQRWLLLGIRDNQQTDNKPNVTQNNDNKIKYTQHNDIDVTYNSHNDAQNNDNKNKYTQHNDTRHDLQFAQCRSE